MKIIFHSNLSTMLEIGGSLAGGVFCFIKSRDIKRKINFAKPPTFC
jgi:hypothetical protein